MATIRMTGLISGMDTESIIKELISAQKLKNKKTTDKLTLSEWKEDKWKELNTKLFKLYTEDLSKMRLQASYLTKKVTSSNDSLVTVTGGADAPKGAHTITISQLASPQNVTGGQLDKDKNGNTITTSTKLADLGMTSSDGKNTVITIKNGSKESNLIVSSTTTLGDFIDTCKNIGLNASYDKNQKRLFISSKESGAASAFSIKTGEISSDAASALNDVKSLVNFTGIGTSGQSSVTAAIKTLEGTSEADMTALYQKVKDGTAGSDAAEQKKIDALKTLRDYAVKKAETDLKADSVKQVKASIKSDILDSIADPDTETLDTLKAQIQSEIDAGTLPAGTDVEAAAKERYKQNQAVYNDLKAQIQEKIDDGKFTLPEGQDIDQYTHSIYDVYAQADKDTLFTKMVDKKYSSDTIYKDEADNIYNNTIEAYKENILTGTGGLVEKLSAYTKNSTISDTTGTSNLTKIGLDEITGEAKSATSSDKMTVVAASDSKITLDGAELTGTSNVITANGLTITATGTTAVGETITLSVNDNTEANYEMVKNFITKYNEILKEMNNLYYADSSRGYDPLSDDEKEAMTDDQVEKWETKIKDSILRRDDSLGSLISSMKNEMMSSVTVDGKKYSLATFGIQTSTDYTEKGLLHIYGNKDDSTYSDKTDKLLKALTEDPDTTMKALTGIFQGLYDTVNEKMSSIPNVRSVSTFYNDKLLDKEQTDYKKQIAILEDKLTDMENKYYKQFSAMETALAKLQSQSNALAGLLGTSSN